MERFLEMHFSKDFADLESETNENYSLFSSYKSNEVVSEIIAST